MATPLRILHLGKYFPPVNGGIERFLADLVYAQRAEGHDVRVLVHSDGTAYDDPPWLLRCPVWIRLIFAPIAPTIGLWLRRELAAFQPDLLHLHMPNLSVFWALLLPSARRVPWIVHWHSDVVPSRHKFWLRMAYPWYRIFERAMLERADAVIVTSPQYLEASEPLHPWRHKCHVIPLGLDAERLPELPRSAGDALWKGGGLRLLATGRLTYYKGFETLIDAVMPLEEAELVIVGEGEERAALERRLAASGPAAARIRLAGSVDDDTLMRLMASCDVFCLPSRERTEAFGLVLLEAMRYGRPLLASELPGSGVPWVARHGANALLAPMDDPLGWRERLRELAADGDLRAALGAAGSGRFWSELTVDKVCARISALYALVFLMAVEDVPAYDDEEIDAAPLPVRGRMDLESQPRDRVLVVIPALNESDCIGDVIDQARAYANVDVLVVDDGSRDGTPEVAERHGARVLRTPLWQGAWGAIQTGLRYAVRHGYAAVVTMDADGQHEPGYLPDLMRAAQSADVVIASCPSRGSRMRHLAWAYFRMLTGFDLDDLTSGFRYYNARACRLLAGDEATLLDYQDVGVLLLLRHARLKIVEVSVAMNPRRSGASRVFSSWWKVVRYMAETTLLCLSRWTRASR